VNVRGASIWKVPFSDGLVCAVAPGAGSRSISAELAFNFPKSVFLTGVLVLPLPDVAFASYEAQCARLSLAVVDEVNQPLFSDSRGTLLGTTNAPVAAPLFQLFGRSFRPYALQRPIAALDVWRFTVQNADTANAQALAGIFLYFGEAT
jgi:hypothetical protein